MVLRATFLLVAILLATSVLASEIAPPAEVSATDTPALAAAANAARDAATRNEQIEKELQGLSWKQFCAVIEAIPKLKADVDAYGPLGWSYVHARYQRYGWRKNLARLNDADVERLIALIASARSIRD